MQCSLCTVLGLIYAAKKSLSLVYLRKFWPSAKIRRKIIGASGSIFNICVCFECISDKKKLCNFTS